VKKIWIEKTVQNGEKGNNEYYYRDINPVAIENHTKQLYFSPQNNKKPAFHARGVNNL